VIVRVEVIRRQTRVLRLKEYQRNRGFNGGAGIRLPHALMHAATMLHCWQQRTSPADPWNVVSPSGCVFALSGGGAGRCQLRPASPVSTSSPSAPQAPAYEAQGVPSAHSLDAAAAACTSNRWEPGMEMPMLCAARCGASRDVVGLSSGAAGTYRSAEYASADRLAAMVDPASAAMLLGWHVAIVMSEAVTSQNAWPGSSHVIRLAEVVLHAIAAAAVCGHPHGVLDELVHQRLLRSRAQDVPFRAVVLASHPAGAY